MSRKLITENNQVIYLDAVEMRERVRTRNGRTFTETYRVYLTECRHVTHDGEICGRPRYLPLRKAKAVKRCAHCQRVEAGLANWQKNGMALIESGAAWRKANPVEPHYQFARLLDEAGIDYREEFVIQADDSAYAIDFLVDNVCVELNGHYWHDRPEQRIRDLRKRQAVARRGWHWLVLDSAEIGSYTSNHIAQLIRNCRENAQGGKIYGRA